MIVSWKENWLRIEYLLTLRVGFATSDFEFEDREVAVVRVDLVKAVVQNPLLGPWLSPVEGPGLQNLRYL